MDGQDHAELPQLHPLGLPRAADLGRTVWRHHRQLRYASGGDCRDWLEGEALPALAERSGICRVRLLEADEAQSAPDTSEARMRGDEGGNAWAPWAIIADGIGPDWLGPALDAAGLEAWLAERGALDIATGRYDLVFGMENRD